jgi:hypothetical protein
MTTYMVVVLQLYLTPVAVSGQFHVAAPLPLAKGTAGTDYVRKVPFTWCNETAEVQAVTKQFTSY